MADYDFHSLHDKEFEILVNDLLSRHFDTRIERFKPGRDGGIDGRFYKDGNESIIQSKHWLKSGVSQLINYLKNTEKNKVEKLNPSTYILATSIPLSVANKAAITDIFSPYVKSGIEIFGQEDLNDLLRSFPELEEKHYKLWLTSSNVLRTILQSGIIGRSGFNVERIKKESSKYVVSENHTIALEKLQKLHSIIITGAPGIGKTTLANQLSLYYVAKGFEFIAIEDSIRDAEDLYKADTKQLFYYDDFLGRNFLLALDHHQDSKIVNFIKRISKDSKKRFILTSRTNILNQGKQLSELFDIEKVDQNEFEVQVDFLTDLDKAKILYNHTWFGDLSNGYFDELVEERRYFDIIRHQNFNPRIVSFITDSYRISNIPKEGYWTYIQETLDNPKDVWRNAIEIQTDNDSRHVLIGVVFNGQAILESELYEFINRLRNNYGLIKTSRTNQSMLELLVGALLNRNLLKDKVYYDLFNPSIADFVIATYTYDYGYMAKIITCLESYQALSNLKSFFLSGSINNAFYENCLRGIFNNLKATDKQNLSYSFFIKLSILFIQKGFAPHGFDEIIKNQINQFVNELIEPEEMDHLLILEHALKKNWINDVNNLQLKLKESLREEYVDWDSLIKMSELSILFDFEMELHDLLKEAITDDLNTNLKNLVIQEGIYYGIYEIEDIDDHDLRILVKDQLEEPSIPFDSFDIDAICESFDFEDVIQHNIKSSKRDPFEEMSPETVDEEEDQDISDLFERY